VKKGSLEDIAGLCEESEASTHNIVHEGKVSLSLFIFRCTTPQDTLFVVC
jgi:hypothetical protein